MRRAQLDAFRSSCSACIVIVAKYELDASASRYLTGATLFLYKGAYVPKLWRGLTSIGPVIGLVSWLEPVGGEFLDVMGPRQCFLLLLRSHD